VDDLEQWLGEQLDEDEEDARRGYLKADPLPDYDGWDKSGTASLPPVVAARVLREIDAKRQIMECHEPWTASNGDIICGRCGREHIDGRPGGHFPCQTLRLLALPYADRPGYREEWRP
jgi:hypothetical protein